MPGGQSDQSTQSEAAAVGHLLPCAITGAYPADARAQTLLAACPHCTAPLQAQVGDIGLMGGPAKLDGKAVEGVRIFLGGTIGENPTVRAWGGIGQ